MYSSLWNNITLKCNLNADNESGLKLHLGPGWSFKGISCFQKCTATMSKNFHHLKKTQHDSSMKMWLCSNLTLWDRSQQMQGLRSPCVHMHTLYSLLCMSQRQCKFWPFTKFGSPRPDICIWFCGRPRLPLRSVQRMRTNTYEQDCLVCDKVSVSCSLVWPNSPGSWVLLSTLISLPNTAPSPQKPTFSNSWNIHFWLPDSSWQALLSPSQH